MPRDRLEYHTTKDMTSYSSIRSRIAGLLGVWRTPSSGLAASLVRVVHPTLKRPAVVVSLALATLETGAALVYGHSLASLDVSRASLSFIASFVGTAATYLLVIQFAATMPGWARTGIVALVALSTVLMQVVCFGIYREFATLPTVSIIDFVRQTPQYALALFKGRLDPITFGLSCLVLYVVFRAVRRGLHPAPTFGPAAIVGLLGVIVGSHALARSPFMSVSQQLAWLVVQSSHGEGLVNQKWEPNRLATSTMPAKHPVNIVIFRLEEVAAQATTLERPELPTTPLLKTLVDRNPDHTFVARRHFANSTATDVSVLSIYTGLSPAAELKAHQQSPILWDYFTAAGYDTALFMPFHLEWGDFKHRFNARPGQLNLKKLLDAGNSGRPLVYDNSINDSDVVAEAVAYQTQRGWAEPFLQIVSIKMPHAIGEGARVNRLSYDKWENEPERLHHYYNGIRHDDLLIDEFVSAIPVDKRDRTIRVFVSDHGTRLFTRTDGVQVLSRLDNYHEETTRVPFVVHLPEGVRQVIPKQKIQNLKRNLSTRVTSNIDLVPTLIGLVGIPAVNPSMQNAAWLRGRDLTTAVGETDVVVQVNTGPLRRWDREHFGLVLNNGRYHYMFSMGRELLFDLDSDLLENTNLADDPRFAAVVERGRAVASQIPELLRIQRKYREAEEDDAVASAPGGHIHPMTALGALQGNATVSAAGGESKLLAEYSIPRPTENKVVQGTFAVRVEKGAGKLDWQLRSEPTLKHFAHVDTLRAGSVHRLEFRWQPATAKSAPLTVQLFGTAEGKEFTLRAEQDGARLVSATVTRELELLTLSREPRGQAVGVYHLDRFKEHACLAGGNGSQCPNGYLVWGPYVQGAKGTDVQLRYDIDADRAGAKVWFDLSARGGKERLARSRVFQIEEPGTHSFELFTQLRTDAEGIEGRLNANGGSSLQGHVLDVRYAELSLAAPKK